MEEKKLLSLVGTLYDATIDKERWPMAMEQLATTLDCPAAAVTLHDPLKREVRLVADWGFTAEFQSAMMKALPINPFVPSGWFMEIDEPYTGVGLLGRDEYFATRFHREVLKPFGYCDAAMSIIAKTTQRQGGLSLPHTIEQGEWTSEQLASIRLIVPHVRRAVMMADLLDSRCLQQDILSAALDLLTTAVVLVDDGMRIVHDNTAAQQLMDQGTVLRREGNRLSTRDPTAALEIKNSVELISKGGSTLAPRAGTVAIQASSGKEFAVWILPLDSGSRREMAAPFEAKAAIFAREFGDTSAFPGELFVKRYGITPGECRVLMMLVQGMSVAETCDALGIGEPTVKTHLSRLFAKTGTSGQAELMRVAVSALAPAQRQAPST